LLESFLASWELDHAPLTDLPAGGSNCEIKKEMRGEKIDQKERSLMDEKLATYYLNLAHCEIVRPLLSRTAASSGGVSSFSLFSGIE